MEKLIKLARYRTTPYVVNYRTSGGTKRYEWSGSKGTKHDIKRVPEEVVDWLSMNTRCFKNGQLVIIEEDEVTKDLVDNIVDREEYENNTHTKEEVLKILQGNYKKMEKELGEITSPDEKKFVVDVAKEIAEDLTAGKQKMLAEWVGISKDLLFDE